ncbi:M56 family metallopeptidase [Dyadobacter subterraneus]|uniref:M56 family metallopeptidase n=1 Tax=Dyadobacter subterraneus TaxID=2773304 RepID=A0ABR9W6K4_9BACT|nr:M56 family metallopeptidase [Dyadobacter subterraneus]MBE9461065.1 M56 family metallopeptidase [Dyadobacter subterraneus]
MTTSAPKISTEIITQKFSEVSSLNSPQIQLTITDIILTIYFLGVIFMFTKLLAQLIKLCYTLWKSPSEKLENGIILIRNRNTFSPYSFFRWIVCDPKKHSTRELEHILAHESEHILQWHSLDLLLAEAQRIVLWFNPFAWFHQKMVQENLEYLADHAVLKSGFQKKQYQFSLLKTVMQRNEIPLTNSFAQSLLKKRIRMMNRKPSQIWVIGKYAALVAILYLSSAFVAPYSREIELLIPETTIPKVIEFIRKDEIVKSPKLDLLEKGKQNIPDVLPKTKKSKWVLERNGTLYWAISPLATLDDINEIRKEIKSFGGEMNINKIEYDPLQKFITTLTVDVKINRSAGRGFQNENSSYTPMKGSSGYITKNGNLGMGFTPPESINLEIEKDYQKAISLQKINSNYYLEDEIKSSFKGQNMGFSGRDFSYKTLKSEKAEDGLKQIGIEIAFDNTLTIMPVNQFAKFYLNGTTSTLSDLNTISFDQLEEIRYFINTLGQRYILVRTK